MPNDLLSTFEVRDNDVTIEVSATKALRNAPIEMAEETSLGVPMLPEGYLYLLRGFWNPPTLVQGDSSFKQWTCCRNGHINIDASMTMDVDASTRRFVDTLRTCWSPEVSLLSITFRSLGHPDRTIRVASLDSSIFSWALSALDEWGMTGECRVTYEDRILEAADTIRILNKAGVGNGAVFTITPVNAVEGEPMENDNAPIAAGIYDDGAGPADRGDKAKPEDQQELAQYAPGKGTKNRKPNSGSLESNSIGSRTSSLVVESASTAQTPAPA